MDEALRAKIEADLKRSGFYSEMLVVRTFRSHGWDCRGTFTYLDKDSEVSRECDFEAIRTATRLTSDSLFQRFALRIVGEVKKSERPWIVFKDAPISSQDPSPGKSELFDAWDNMIVARNLPTDHLRLAEALSAKSLVSMRGWKACGMHEFEKKPSDKSVWHSAFISACKAAETAGQFRLRTGR